MFILKRFNHNDINQFMLDNTLCYAYYGGKKKHFVTDEENTGSDDIVIV